MIWHSAHAHKDATSYGVFLCAPETALGLLDHDTRIGMSAVQLSHMSMFWLTMLQIGEEAIIRSFCHIAGSVYCVQGGGTVAMIRNTSLRATSNIGERANSW